MTRRLTAAAALLVSFLTGALTVEGQEWVGERLCPTGLSSGGEFGSAVAIAENGTIAVGDYRHDRVVLFSRDGCQQLDIIQGSAGEWFGFDVAIDDQRLLVGAPKAGGTGEAYLVRLNNGRAVSAPQPVPGLVPRPGPGDEAGSSVAMSGETLAIGARGAAGRRGRVYSGSEGDLPAVPMPPGGVAQRAELGQSVALAGRTLVVGAPSPFRGSGSPGAAYVFEVGSVGTATAILPTGSRTRRPSATPWPWPAAAMSSSGLPWRMEPVWTRARSTVSSAQLESATRNPRSNLSAPAGGETSSGSRSSWMAERR